MKVTNVIILILIAIFCSCYDYAISYKLNVDNIETQFQSALSNVDNIMYTKVPRGLIISIDERYFFDNHDVLIKESSLPILDSISQILRNLPNLCVIENHTQDKSKSEENWELSVQRASNIAEYLVLCEELPNQRIFPLGFGEIMPFNDNVAPEGKMNNRIDFVIIEYEAKR